ncbi:MAG: uracil-DNA glycosylase [Actinomycetota bacterium]
MEQARQEALGCTRCRLSVGRTRVVWWDGNPDSDLMFVGEAPGFHEDKVGKPFVGAAGKLLDTMLASIGMDRTRCVICNVIKCRPPDNRDPQPDEIETCSPFLKAQIEFIKPSVIVTLGNFATRFVLQRQVPISRVRGQVFAAFGARVIPTFHPASVLYSGGPGSAAWTTIQQDFQTIANHLTAGRRQPATASDPPPLARPLLPLAPALTGPPSAPAPPAPPARSSLTPPTVDAQIQEAFAEQDSLF